MYAHTRTVYAHTQVHPTIFDDPRFLSSKAVETPQKKTIARPESPLVFSIGRSLKRGTLIPFKQGGEEESQHAEMCRFVASHPARAVRSSSYMYVRRAEYVIPEELPILTFGGLFNANRRRQPSILLIISITSDLPAPEASLNAIEPLLQATDQSTSSIINPSSGPVRSSHSPI